MGQRDRLYHAIGAPRAVSTPGTAAGLFIPYTRLAAKTGARHVRGAARNVDPIRQVVSVALVEGGETEVPYDYLVLATGSALAAPVRPLSTSSGTDIAALEAVASAVAAARTVLVVGGGPSGVEVAGDIKAVHPGKAVHLVHSEPALLSSRAVAAMPADFQARIAATLAKVGVTVHLGSRVPRPAPTALPAGVTALGTGVFLGEQSIKLTDGTTLTPDVVLFTTGGGVNTGYLAAHLGAALDANGHVRMLPTLQVEGHANIFAVGDITDFAESKTAFIAKTKHVPIATANLLALARAKASSGTATAPPTLKRHTPSPVGAMLIPIGPKAGAGQVGSLKFGNMLTSSLKGSHMFIAKTNDEMGYSKPGVYPDAGAPAVDATIVIPAPGARGAATPTTPGGAAAAAAAAAGGVVSSVSDSAAEPAAAADVAAVEPAAAIAPPADAPPADAPAVAAE